MIFSSVKKLFVLQLLHCLQMMLFVQSVKSELHKGIVVVKCTDLWTYVPVKIGS